MGSEHAFWRQFRDKLTEHQYVGPTKGRIMRVENGSIEQGTPDTFYAFAAAVDDDLVRYRPSQGWIELKHVEHPPKRRTTPVRYKYRPGQVEWLAEYWELGIKAWVLAQVGREYMLHPGCMPKRRGVGIIMPLEELRMSAWVRFSQPWTPEMTKRLVETLA